MKIYVVMTYVRLIPYISKCILFHPVLTLV